MKSRERAIRVPREQTEREDPHGCDRGHERDEPVAGAQYTEVHHRDNDAGADAGRVVEIVPLESVHDRSEDGERKAHAEVHADDQQYVSRSTYLIGLDVEEQIDARGNERRHDEAQDAESGEHQADRAEDLVQRRAVAPGAVLCDEPHQRAAIPEVEHAEIPGHRRRESPQSVRRAAEVRHVERQHHEADDAVDEDHEIACADVSRDEFERAVRGSPLSMVHAEPCSKVSARRFAFQPSRKPAHPCFRLVFRGAKASPRDAQSTREVLLLASTLRMFR